MNKVWNDCPLCGAKLYDIEEGGYLYCFEEDNLGFYHYSVTTEHEVMRFNSKNGSLRFKRIKNEVLFSERDLNCKLIYEKRLGPNEDWPLDRIKKLLCLI